MQHKRYEFVELVEAFMSTCYECDSITAYFNACQPGEINVTLVATTDCPHGDLQNPETIYVFPYGSDTARLPVIFNVSYLPSFQLIIYSFI